jgi:hypothetical protein
MSKWVEPNYVELAKKQKEVELAKKRFIFKMRIGGTLSVLTGIGFMALSVLTAIKRLLVGIILLAIGLAALQSTKTI